MGASRPTTVDVARRLAAAIAVAGTLLVALVVGAGAATAAPTMTGSAGAEVVATPQPGTLQAAGDTLVVTASAARGDDDPDAGWAEPAAVSVLLAAPAGFFVGLRDTSTRDSTGWDAPQLRGRSPPAAGAPAPR